MKKLIIILIAAGLFAACSSKQQSVDPCEGKTGVSGWVCKVKN